MARNRSIMEMYNGRQSPGRPPAALWVPLPLIKGLKCSCALKILFLCPFMWYLRGNVRGGWRGATVHKTSKNGGLQAAGTAS